MKLRIKFNRVDNTVTQINFASLTQLEIRVNGILTVPIADGDYALVNIPTICITDENVVYIKAQDLLNPIFENTFKVYGYDLGNNGTTSNPDFEINLIDYSNVLNTFVYASLIAYRNPNNYEIHYYNSNNSIGNKSYRGVITEQVFSANLQGFYITDKSISIYQDIFYYVNGILVSNDTSTDINVLQSIKYPTSDLYISSDSNCNDDCYSIEANNLASMYFDFSQIDTYYVDDILNYLFTTLFIRYELIDYAGVLIKYEDKYINITNPVYQFVAGALDNSVVPQPNNFQFDFSYFGDYKIRVTYQLGNACKTMLQCFKHKDVKSCNFFKLKETDVCGVYELTNASSDTISLNVYKLNANKTFDFLNIYYLLAGEKISSISFNEDGVYKFTVVRNGIEYSTIKIVYCKTEKCIHDLVYKIIMDNCCDKCNNKDSLKFNKILINVNVFLSLIKEYHSYNTSFYNEFSKTQIDNIYNIDDIIKRLNEYCYECQDKTIENISVIKELKYNGCGCQ